MSAQSRAHTALERRVEKLEQHVDDLTRVVERLNEVVANGRHDGHILEVFPRSDVDGNLPSMDLHLER